MPAPRVSIRTEDFDLQQEIAALRGGDRTGRRGLPASSACVRDRNAAARVSALALEHYPGMTERAIEAMIVEAEARFDVLGALVIHRVGRLLPGERIVLVAVARRTAATPSRPANS